MSIRILYSRKIQTGSRTSTYYDEYGRFVGTTTSNIQNGAITTSRKLQRGDRHNPTPYETCRIRRGPGMSGWIKSYAHWAGVCFTQNAFSGAEDVPYYPPYHLDDGYQLTTITSYDWTNLTNDALAKLNGSKLDSALILAESYKTAKYLADTTTVAVRVLLDIKHLRFSKALKRLGITKKEFVNLKTPSSALLQLRYAINPLLMDVQGAFEVARGSMSKELERAMISGSATSNEDVTDLTDPTLGWTHNTSFKRKVKVYAKIVCPEIAATKHLSSINPAVIAWELVPFSFVADWFLPIGTFLTASTALVGLAPASSYRGTKIKTVSRCRVEYEPTTDWCPIYSAQYKESSGQAESYTREVPTVYPTAMFPSLEQGLGNIKNVATAIALLASLRK